MTKKSRQKFKYLENEKSFSGEMKTTFHHFLKDGKNGLRPESVPSTKIQIFFQIFLLQILINALSTLLFRR